MSSSSQIEIEQHRESSHSQSPIPNSTKNDEINIQVTVDDDQTNGSTKYKNVSPQNLNSPSQKTNTQNNSNDNRKPHVIAFINHSSGSGKGNEITEMLTDIIGTDNIYRLGGQYGPKQVLQDSYLQHQQFRVIVCGGDGSVNWILSVIADLGYNDVSVGIIPNGTGNDTSRYLGWGQCQFGTKETRSNVLKMCDPDTPVRDFDRWQLFMSFRKDEMLSRTNRLKKSNEVPYSHIYDLKELPLPSSSLLSSSPSSVSIHSQNSTFLKKQNSSNESQSLQKGKAPSSSQSKQDNNNNHHPAADKDDEDESKKVSYYFPKYFKSIVRLDELQFLERYKWLHSDHQPIEFTSLTHDQRRYAQRRLSLLPNDKKSENNNNGGEVIENDIDNKLKLRSQYSQFLENNSKWFRFTWSFNNYFSFGIDAQVMNYFGIHRDNHPGCFCCRCCTLTWIGTCSTATCCACQKRPLRYRIDILYKDGDLTPVKAVESPNVMLHPKSQLPPLVEVDIKGRPIKKNNKDSKQQQATDPKLQPINSEVNIDHTGDDGIDIVIETTDADIEGINGVEHQLNQWASPYETQFIDNPHHLINGYKWLSATFDPMQYGALVLLNIPSYAGGRNIWGDNNKSQMNTKTTRDYLIQELPQDTKDGKLEMVAFNGFQQMQFTVMTQSATYRLGQLQGLRVYMENDGYVQLDGEAWIQPQGVLEIFRSKPGKMLFNDEPDYPCC